MVIFIINQNRFEEQVLSSEVLLPRKETLVVKS